MRYYVNNNRLFSVNSSICDPLFSEITKEDYEYRLSLAEAEREQGEYSNIQTGSGVEIW